MKNILPIIIFSLLMASCGDNKIDVDKVIAKGDLKEIREAKTTLSTEQQELQQQIALLDTEIDKLDDTKKLPLVTVFKTKDTLFNHFLELQGSVQTKQNVVIYPEMSGTLKRVYVKEGQQVAKGQLLATIDDGGMGQQVAQLEVQAKLAKTTFERQKKLWDQNIGSEIQFLQAKTTYEASNNAVNQAKSQLGKSSIRAPFSGVVDEVITEQGTVVVPGQSQVFRIVNLKDMYIEVEVPESHIANISKGTMSEVYIPVLGKTIETKVRQVGNYINPNNRAFKVEIPVTNKDGNIKPNLTARVRINDYINNKAVLIPQSIISENAAGEQYAYVAQDIDAEKQAIAKRVIITTGKTQGDFVEVLSGIKPGSSLIEEGARSVREDQKVKITTKN